MQATVTAAPAIDAAAALRAEVIAPAAAASRIKGKPGGGSGSGHARRLASAKVGAGVDQPLIRGIARQLEWLEGGTDAEQWPAARLMLERAFAAIEREPANASG